VTDVDWTLVPTATGGAWLSLHSSPFTGNYQMDTLPERLRQTVRAMFVCPDRSDNAAIRLPSQSMLMATWDASQVHLCRVALHLRQHTVAACELLVYAGPELSVPGATVGRALQQRRRVSRVSAAHAC